MKKILILSLLVPVLLLSFGNLALAQDGSDTNPSSDASLADGSDTNPSSGSPNIDSPEKILRIIERIGNWMFTFLLALAVLVIIYAAFLYLTSQGGDKVAQAHKTILYAAVAIAVAMLAKGFVKLVESLIS
ncbi:MAG: hypothetical protein COU06_00170 [Candidatus Harrisonbacteria bacterium CG10_big_fil_rev_8_21_14_0_10_38_8]|uniref:Uncharacterized protein n=1 Tax=Candidatus Harrisonbacteria bacterium CG10_big_fil_rev_8_21_14_0_10_38_8 TaxID=1974582 RepID=A0A2M6WKS8_9BACT|nr:MAG: hypothetical protein COU06_00170 [Candidatus Harrisonbacteria bacterium CG10_big_fil_rev_8_21_14_0_10_38_8]